MKLNSNNYIVQPPKVTWVLAANRADAALFGKRQGESLEFIKRFENPRGKLSEQDSVFDDPSKPTWRDQVAIDFSKTLAKQISLAKDHAKFSELMFIAEPRFLGFLRKSLPAKLKKIPIHEVPNELKFIATDKVEKIVSRALKASREKHGKAA